MPATVVVPSQAPSGSVLTQLAGIAARHRLDDVARRCRTAVDQAEAGQISVAVLGRFKAGKTTLLNQLIGEDLLPVQAIPATAVITGLRFGPRVGVRVAARDGATFAIDAADLRDWVTESGNPGNARGVERVEVSSPALGDLAHLVLVDTPGTGSTWAHNTETSLGWLPNVGAALVAINATQPLAEDDLELIRLVQPHTPNLLIALTKVDLLGSADLAEVIAHVQDRLADALGVAPGVYPVSIAARHRPQRERLREALRDLDRSHDEAVAALAGHRTARLAAETRAYLELARAAASSRAQASADLRRALAVEAGRLPVLRAQALAQLRPAEAAILTRMQDRRRRVLPAATSAVVSALAAELPSWRGSLGAESMRLRDWLRRALAAVAAPFAQESAQDLGGLLEQGLAPVGQTGEAFLQRLGELVRAALGVDLEVPVPVLLPRPVEPVDVVVDRVFESHLELVSWAVPMGLVRPLVHRHFAARVPWQVEKNLTRAAFRTAAAARRSLERSVDDYVAGLGEILATCRNLVDVQPSDLPVITADLDALTTLARAPVSPPR